MKIPLAFKIAGFSIALVLLVSGLVGVKMYDHAMRELQDHEETDLREEAKLRCRAIADQLNTLKRDTAQIASDPVVRQILHDVHAETASSADSSGPERRLLNAADQADIDRILANSIASSTDSRRDYLRHKFTSLAELDILHDSSRLTGDDQSADDDKPLQWTRFESKENESPNYSAEGSDPTRYKSYFQIRMIDAKGLEVYRMEMDCDQKNDTSNTQRLALYETTKREPKTDSCYFEAALELEQQYHAKGNLKRSELIRPFLSPFELNSEKGIPQKDRPTVRCWMPVFSDGGVEFLGIVIVNFDFQQLRVTNKRSPRHLVYLTNEKGEYLINPDDTMEFQFKTDSHGSIDGNANAPTIAKSEWGLRTNLADTDKNTNLAATFQSDFNDMLVSTNGGKQERKLESLGWKLAGLEESSFRFSGDGSGDHSFTLAKFSKPADPKWIDGWTQLTEAMAYISLASESKPNDHALVNMRPTRFRTSAATSQTLNNSFHVSANVPAAEMNQLLSDLLAEYAKIPSERSEHRQNVVKELPSIFENAYKYDPIKCENFAAFFYRIYLDPGIDLIWKDKQEHKSDHFVSFLMAFSKEELQADLQGTRASAIKWALTFAALGSLLAVALSWMFTRRLKKLTTVAEQIAKDQNRAVDFPSPGRFPDEVTELALAFEKMSAEVTNRQRQLEDNRIQLTEMVQQRTSKLTEKIQMLNAAKSELEGLSEAKDVFLASVSHELRNPLNAVMGFCQLLEMSELDEQQTEDVTKIGTNAKRLLQLINDILDYQKIIMGGVSIESEVFNLNELLGEVEDGIKHLAEKNQSHLVVDRVATDETIFADRRRLQQVLINIAGNACKFTRHGTVEISAEQIEKDDTHWWQFQIRDNGPGMDEETKSKLYTPFHRARVSQGGGTGLGLVICKGFVDLMEGAIGLESELGQGSLFSILLPATEHDKTLAIEKKKNEENKIASKQANAGGSLSEFQAANNSSVLVIDDEPEFLEFVRRTVEIDGWDVIEAHNGAEALAILGEVKPAAIILDLVMPEMDGFEFLSAYIEQAKELNIPIIVLTGLETTLGDEKFLSESVVRVLRKGRFSQEDLLTELKYQTTESGAFSQK